MAAFEIPTTSDEPKYTQFVELEGTTYQLLLEWNARAGGWFLGINDEDGNSLAGSLRLVTNWPLLRQKTSPLLPPGEFFAVTTDGLGDPGRDDLGNRCTLIYLEEADL